jgi:hypothetical protein
MKKIILLFIIICSEQLEANVVNFWRWLQSYYGYKADGTLWGWGNTMVN